MIVAYGLCVHIIFLFSIFDIYFKSPIVRGVVPYQPQHDAGADRLVLFVVDGLRAESFVNHTTMPYLRSVASEHGRWGISNTRVPTESRPGHVAVIAGFYEDPSAVAKGWKENPVDFDSVFNQSKHTWCWGTYDIVDIFTKGTVDNHIYVDKFDPYDQNFSTDKNTTLLDLWVFEKVKHFFQEAKYDSVLTEKLKMKKIVFFLHLLGTDTAGHTHKPKTQNYITNLKFVDEGVKEMQKVIEEFYGYDNKTSFLMTSDHGMTDWGSHGAGDLHETETPYVLWGSGTKQTSQNSHNMDILNSLPSYRRFDIQQADLAPLMSSILSIPVPVNSVGKLPHELLDMSLENKAKAIYSNSRQLAAQYDRKRLNVEINALYFLYTPYEPFDKRKFNEILEHTERLLAKGQYEKLILLSNEIINLSLSGLVYYHNYYQRPLQILITLSFVGWIMYLLNVLLIHKANTLVTYPNTNKYTLKRKEANTKQIANVVATTLALILCFMVYVQNLPLQYYVYCLLPVYLWWNVFSSMELWKQIFSSTEKHSTYLLLIEVVCYVLGSVAMGLSFTHRWTLSVPLLGMAVWPLLTTSRSRLSSTTLVIWIGTCMMLSIFSFMPVVGKDVHIELVIAAGIIWFGIHAIYFWKFLVPLRNVGNEDRSYVYNIIQLLLLLLALQNIYVQSKRFELGTPVSSMYQMIAWCLAVFSMVLPLASSQKILCRLSAINISVLTFYLMLSVSHEGLFLVTLMLNVLCWASMEFKLTRAVRIKLADFTFENEGIADGKNVAVTSQERALSRQDFRRAFFFLLYIVLAFFGTGNIASMNSFEVRWVTCFITSFQPFVMTFLILLKTLTPFVSVACTFRAIQFITQAPMGYLNIIVLIYSNIMGIQLFFQVKNTGSWLEIGTSISQFVIVQIITLFIVLIHYTARVLTQINIYTFAHNVFKSRKKYV